MFFFFFNQMQFLGEHHDMKYKRFIHNFTFKQVTIKQTFLMLFRISNNSFLNITILLYPYTNNNNV